MFDSGALIFKLQTQGKAVFKQDMAEVDQATEKVGKSAAQSATRVSQTGDALDATGRKARTVKAPLDDAGKATSKVGDESAKAAPKVQTLGQRVSETEQEFNAVGGTLVGVGAALATATTLTAKAAIDWESAWTGVTKTIDATPEQLEEIQVGLRGLTRELPSSHEEIAAVAEAAGQLGVKSSDIVSFTKTMIDLGETTNLSAEEASTSLAQLMNIMGTAGADVGRLGATIVALGNDGASTEADIVQMAQRIAGSGKLVGATEGEVLALANALSSMGVTAELGGGVASRVLQDIYSVVQTGGKKLDQFAKAAGMSASEFAAAFRDDPVRALGAFATGLNGVEASGGNVVKTLTDLGFRSTEEQRVLLQLKGAGDLLTDSLDLQSEAWAENSALTEEAAKRYETTEAKIEMTRNAIVDAAIDFGQVLLPVLEDGLNIISQVATAFGNLPEPVQTTVASFGALASVAALSGGAFLLALPKYVEVVGALRTLRTTGEAATATTGLVGQQFDSTSRKGQSLARVLTGPIGLGLAAAAVGADLLGKYLETLRASSSEVENSLKTATSAAQIFETVGKGREWMNFRDVTADLGNMSQMLDKVRSQDENVFERFTTETQGFRAALGDVGEELALIASSDLPAAQKAFSLLAAETDGSDAQLSKLLEQMPAYRDELIKQASAQDVQIEGLTEAEKAQKLLEIAQGDGVDVTQSAADAYLEASGEVAELGKQLGDLIKALNEANGIGQDAVSANIAYEESLAAAAEQIDNIRKGTEGFAAGIDVTTEAGRENKAMLVDLAEQSQAAAEAQFKLDGNTQAYASTLAAGRQKLIDTAVAMGATQEEAQDLADTIYQMPSQKEIDILADTSQARTSISRLITDFAGRTIRVNVAASGNPVYTKPGAPVGYEADGGIVSYFADGGFALKPGGEDHRAQIARAGSVRVWAEEESDESYIPLHPTKRAQSIPIWEETGRRLGVYGFANGGITGPGQGSAPSAVRVVVQPKGGINLLDYIDVRVEQGLAGAASEFGAGWSGD